TKGNKEKEKKKEKEKEKGKEKNAKKVPKIDPNLAILTGRVVLKGTPPEIEELKVPDGHRDRAACAAHVRSEVLILGKSQQLKNVVVAIDEKFRPKKTPPPRVVQFDNRNCLFVPHVLATVVGSTLELKNSDPFIHNSRGLLNPIGHINTAIPPKGVVKKTLRKPGWGVMKCDFHPWMTAHLHVFRHELFDVTDAAGTYKIVNIPPGTYTFYFWHERVAFKKTARKATLEAGKTTRLDVEIEAPTS
ncbi:MAG: carboxypeptidase regulatory-like domain-containing protein, partial [Planctomycetota bacterium]|nr:carboxypeptidase regulatory-like domain-containing protein [Planctomycetota bacterium]